MKRGVAADATAELLKSTPGIRRVPNRLLDLFIVRNFLGAEGCAEFCALIDANRRPSTIADDQGIAQFRTSEPCDLEP